MIHVKASKSQAHGADPALGICSHFRDPFAIPYVLAIYTVLLCSAPLDPRHGAGFLSLHEQCSALAEAEGELQHKVAGLFGPVWTCSQGGVSHSWTGCLLDVQIFGRLTES